MKTLLNALLLAGGSFHVYAQEFAESDLVSALKTFGAVLFEQSSN